MSISLLKRKASNWVCLLVMLQKLTIDNFKSLTNTVFGFVEILSVAVLGFAELLVLGMIKSLTVTVLGFVESLTVAMLGLIQSSVL